LTALGAGGATTTYGYDAFGQRVFQTGTTTTYLYPFKWYSVASSTGSGAKFATTTDYVFNGDSLVAISLWKFNEALSHHFASGFLRIVGWLLSERLRQKQFFYIGYRAVFYVASLFCFFSVAVITILLISNLR
jgi:hypothetical protein